MALDWSQIGQGIAQTAGGTLAGNLVNQIFAKTNARQNWRYQKKAADYSYQQDLNMWNTQNAYNTPASQMARLTEAGLNPALMYGTGQGANVSKEMPKYNNPSVNYEAPIINPLMVLSAFQDFKVKNAQTDNIEAQTETRRLENQLRLGTLSSQIEKMLGEATSSTYRGQLEHLKFLIENQFQDTDANQEPASEQYQGTKKRFAELGISQEAYRRTRAEADVKEQEASMYRMLRELTNNDAEAGTLVKVINNLMSFFGTMLLNKSKK